MANTPNDSSNHSANDTAKDISCDIAVIGAGPAGYVAAIRAAQCGKQVAIIEKEALGGICLNWGCIPTKALLRSAEIWSGLTELQEFGISAKNLSFDSSRIVERSRAVAKKLNAGVDILMRKNNIKVCYGSASLLENGAQNGSENITENITPENITENITIAVSQNSKQKPQRKVSAKHIVIASGARAREVQGLEIDGESVWGYKEAMLVSTLPKSLLVVGGGAIGIEFACYFSAFGVEVTIIEAKKRILPSEDLEIAEMLQNSLAKKGVKFKLGTPIEKIVKNKSQCQVNLKDGSKAVAEKILSAIGVVGNVEGLGLEEAGVEFDKNNGVIKVDPYGRSNKQGIYAIGDVAGAPMLAHKASHEAVVCIEAIIKFEENADSSEANSSRKMPKPINKNHIPACVYSSPQIATVGLSEKIATEKGYQVRLGKFPLNSNGKAIAIGQTEGLVKVVFDKKSGAFLGAQLIGAEVTEMIQGFAIALEMEATEEELIKTIFPHPTISETMQEAVLEAYSRPIHIPPK